MVTSDSSAPYHSEADLVDYRKFNFGELWLIEDGLINIPDADRLGNRVTHNKRAVVIIDNSSQNYSPFIPVINAAPISSRIDCSRLFDIILSKDTDEVKTDSLLRLTLAQPFLKKDLERKAGEISDNSKTAVIDALIEKVGIDSDDL